MHAFLGAQAAWVMLDIAFVAAAWNALQRCLNPRPPIRIGQGGGGGGGGHEECWDVDLYISYDGGNTWAYDETERFCEYMT